MGLTKNLKQENPLNSVEVLSCLQTITLALGALVEQVMEGEQGSYSEYINKVFAVSDAAEMLTNLFVWKHNYWLYDDPKDRERIVKRISEALGIPLSRAMEAIQNGGNSR